MKRASYVDNQGNPIDHNFESKKAILNIFFIIGTILPLVLIGFIIYTAVQNSNCNKVYEEVKTATLEYLKDKDKVPTVEGEDVTISIDKLYSGKYLSDLRTNNMICSGSVKTTKYKNEYIYTLNLTNCNVCTTDSRYGKWSGELTYYPNNKPIVDVIPYYNYYERQIVLTDWSKYYDKEELSKEKSKYGVKLPADENDAGMPIVPEEGNIVEAQKDEVYYYRYKDKRWKWYDIVGNYSAFSSEQPAGFANKDEDTARYTEWSDYSLTYPEEKPYREIKKTTGYQYYYEKDGKKIYANNQNYTAPDDVDETKYNMREPKSADMYQYHDKEWRWYNGAKRRYSSYSSFQPSTIYGYRDDELMSESEYSSWDPESSLTPSNSSYRTEEKKTMTRFRYVYEILSAKVLDSPVTKDKFVSEIGMTVPEFSTLEEYKMEVTYKFKYRKR
ncbi:MAG: hypothetical protein V8R01_01130 [Bacilli bacterium]